MRLTSMFVVPPLGGRYIDADRLKAELRADVQAESCQAGWALLGLILALMILGVLLIAAVPNIKFAVQRDKEAEMLYRGAQVAEGIGRYYNNGQLGAPQLQVPPRWGGFLLDLKKLRDGVTLGSREFKFVRPSALIDPMTSEEWEPVRARDPRIAAFLQAFSASTGTPISLQLQLIAGPPPRLQRILPTEGAPSATDPQTANRQPTVPGQPAPPGVVVVPAPRPGDPVLDDDDDDDDDDDTGGVDPLASIFKDSSNQPGRSNIPIVGVAPRLKGPSVRSLYGLTNYEEWVFIFIPTSQTMPGLNPNQPNQQQGNRLRISP